LLLSLVFSYIYISQVSVEMHLWCGGTYSNHSVANCLQSALVKNFSKIGQLFVKIWTTVKFTTFFMDHSVVVILVVIVV